MKYVSFRDLRGLVEGTSGKKLPSARALRESGIDVVASAEIGDGALLTVYRSGFFTYSTTNGTTVYAVDRCADYALGNGELLDQNFFEGEEWTVRLMLTGEDRLEHNQTVREEKKRFYRRGDRPDDDLERDEIRDPSDFTLELESREALDRMLGVLTERQRQVVELYFVEGITQEMIARRLGIGQRAVAYALEAVLKKIKKTYLGTSKTPSPACVKWED